MASSVKISGSYKDTAPYVKVAGDWKFSKEAWAKVSGSWRRFFLASGVNDSSFNVEDSFGYFSSTVNSIAIQPDGKIVLGGQFVSFNGDTVNRIVRLNADGTLDTAFTSNTGTGVNSIVNSIAIQPDGKIVLGGAFTTFNGATINRILRLNADGTLDTAFTSNTGTGVNSSILSMAIQPDGKILAGGLFGIFNGAAVSRIVRLNADGTRDTAFTTNNGTGPSNNVNSIVIQPDGKIVLGGAFLTFNGVTVNRIVRLNADGTRDTAFTSNTGTGPSDDVRSIVIQPDGKILAGGFFTIFNGVTVNRIVRLNADGTRDTAFTSNTGTGPSSLVLSIAIQPDGKFLIAGFFTTFNGATVNRIVRLNADGTRDTAFTTATGTGASDTTEAIAIQPDGKILVGGSFISFNGAKVDRIVRLNLDGTRDTTISATMGADNTVNSIAIQPDGKIVLGGQFVSFNGDTVNRIVRLNADGTLDTAFTSNTGTGPSDDVRSIVIQPDGKILAGGFFTIFNGVTVNRIVRLNADGTRDTAFTTATGTGANTEVRSIVIQPDGKIVLGGLFATFNGVTVNRIVRLNADGTRDTAFTTATGTGADNLVMSIVIQPDGKIVLGGAFTTFNGATINRILRLNADGTLDTAFTSNTGTGVNSSILSMAIQPDGKIVLGGQFVSFNGDTVNRIVRLNADGTLDTAFTSNTGTGVNSIVNSIAIQPDGKILAGGFFTIFNGVTVNRIVRLNADGTLDTAFTSNTGTGFNGTVFPIIIQPDGKILLGGAFTTFNEVLRGSLTLIGGDLAA